jgi:hypothetical protein
VVKELSAKLDAHQQKRSDGKGDDANGNRAEAESQLVTTTKDGGMSAGG